MIQKSISFTAQTDVGMLRSNNEDAFIAQYIWDENHVLAVAIDGVGGYDGGEVAAEIARKTIIDYLQKYHNGERLDLLKQAVTEANNLIVEQRSEQHRYASMSCVLTACLVEVEKKQVNMVHVGDTRLYEYCRNRFRKLSHDHSLVGYREEIGDLTEEEAMNHPQRNVIGRDVGSERHQIDDKDFLEAATSPLLPNSILLLCSDGLCDMVKSSEMISVLEKAGSLSEKAEQLIRLANQKGGKDNVTVVLVEYLSNEPEPTFIEDESENLSVAEESVTFADRKSPPSQGNKTTWLSRVGIGVLILFSICLGGVGGWWGHQNYGRREPVQVTPTDSLIEKHKDTITLLKNDSVRVFVTGKELKADTVKTDTTRVK